MKEKLPIDGYSKKAFEGELGRLENEGIPYVPPSRERNVDPEWQELRGAMTDEEQKMLTRLDQLYANAQREALNEDRAWEERQVLPVVLKDLDMIANDTETTLSKIGELPPHVAATGAELMRSVQDAKKKFEEGRFLGLQFIKEIYASIHEIYARFKQMAFTLMTADRYGNDRQPPQAA